MFPPQIYFSIAKNGSSGEFSSRDLYLAASRVAPRLENLLDIGVDKFMPIQQLRESYENKFGEGIRLGNVDPLDEAVLREALNILRTKLVIEVSGEEVRIFNQVNRINEVALGLRTKLSGISNLHDLMIKTLRAFGGLPEFTDIYLYDSEAGVLCKTGSTSEADYVSNYDNWQPVRASGIFDIVIHAEDYQDQDRSLVKEVVGTRFFLEPQVRDKGPIFPEDYDKYRRAFKDPNEIRFQRAEDEKGRTVLVTKRHSWLPKTAAENNLRLCSENCGKKEVDHAWDSLDQTIASAIGRIIGDRNAREVWEEEKVSIRRLEAAERKEDKPELAPARKRRGTEYDPTSEQRMWDKGAKYYDTRIAGRVDRDSRNDVMAYLGQRIQEALDNTPSDQRVKILDVACGTGNMLPFILERFKEQVNRLSIVMLDWSPTAIARAQARANQLGIDNLDIQFVVNDMLTLSTLYPGNTFDIAFSHMGSYAPRERIEQTIAGMRAVLKPGGYGTLDIMKKGGTLEVVKRRSTTYEMEEKGIWRGFFVYVWRKIRARALGYAKHLQGGFNKGIYFAPTQEEWVACLKEQGLEAIDTRFTLADQFLLSLAKKSNQREP
jgi:ubiquinone/menaquinone biosynthesis C-methylase UbiE